MEHGFTWFSLLPFIADDPERQLIFTTIFIAAVLFIISATVFNSIKKSPNPLIPSKKTFFPKFL